MSLKPYDEMDYHPLTEKLVDILCARAHTQERDFFRILCGYYFCQVASMMRCQILTLDNEQVPINGYFVDLAPSGFGKGLSTNFFEEKLIHEFREVFMNDTFPLLAAENLPKVANDRAISKSSDPDDELQRVEKEFDSLGPLLFSFDSGTPAAVKQIRHKLLLAQGGSLNLQMDEVGTNLTGNLEIFASFLELYDLGRIKQKLTKNTKENTRFDDIPGRTPTNALLFGTPNKLLDGGKVEEEFIGLLDTGYARRCWFAYVPKIIKNGQESAKAILAQRMNTSTQSDIDDISEQFADLADIGNMNRKLNMSEEVTLMFIEYQLDCERRADEIGDHDEIRKAEQTHRFSKALKLAGAYAFVDGDLEVTKEHAHHAIRMAETSGDNFARLLTRERPWVKLANYVANTRRKVTHPDMMEDLPFYRGSQSQRQEMLNLAIAHGYQNNIIIRKSFSDGVEFLEGETLEATDLNELCVSHSDDIAQGYQNEVAPWEQLHLLTQADGLHWVNHHLIDGHRKEDNAIPGFNMVVIDVDHGVNIETAKSLLEGYKCLFYTTKRHTEQEHRFRIIMPTNYVLKLEASDYKEFMNNLYEWLPFETDTGTNQRARKWLSHDGDYEYLDGDCLDVLPFIPKTSKNEERKQRLDDQRSMDNLERWVINNTGDGNRNNQLLKYALILVDAGFDYTGIRQRVVELNDKLPNKLTEDEIMGTIMVTAGKAIASR